MVSLEVVWSKIKDLAGPLEPIEVSLGEAVGLVLAEPLLADVDLPHSDCAAEEGYAARSTESVPGTLLRVISPPADVDGPYEIETGEAALVDAGAPLPVGADSVMEIEAVRSEAGSGGPRVVEVVQAVDAGRAVTRRGTLLKSNDVLLPAGTRLSPAAVALLASQGCVHPICRRRVRVSLLAIGDQLVNPSEAPILHRERNAANLAISVLLSAAGAMVQDLGCVSEAGAAAALDRATNAPVVIVMGRFTGGLLRRLARDGVEPVISGVDVLPLEPVQYGIIRDEQDYPSSHLLHFPLDPVAAVIGTALLALPIVARLQGGETEGPRRITARLADDAEITPSERAAAIPAHISIDARGTLIARPIASRAVSDLPALAKANAVALFEPSGGPGQGFVTVVPLFPCDDLGSA